MFTRNGKMIKSLNAKGCDMMVKLINNNKQMKTKPL